MKINLLALFLLNPVHGNIRIEIDHPELQQQFQQMQLFA